MSKLLVIELLALLLICVGVAVWSIPAAMIVAGSVVIAAVEVRGGS